MRLGMSVRDVSDFTTWWAEHHGTTKVTKSAWDRHKRNNHFDIELPTSPTTVIDDEVKTLRDMVLDMFKRYQASKQGHVPDSREMREWLSLDAKIADIQQRRDEETKLRALLAGMAYQPEELPILEATTVRVETIVKEEQDASIR